MRVALGADHAGLALAPLVERVCASLGYELTRVVPAADEKVDYPDPGKSVAQAVARGEAALGVLLCGSGIGMSIVANKVAGVRAALVTEPYSARMARQHNDANILCMGARVVGEGLAEECLRSFFSASFEGGRHQDRLNKITAVERGSP